MCGDNYTTDTGKHGGRNRTNKSIGIYRGSVTTAIMRSNRDMKICVALAKEAFNQKKRLSMRTLGCGSEGKTDEVFFTECGAI